MTSREPELYKDKVEISLDGRQIFYLFFGGAVIVGMVFVLGVLVGRRVEARGHIDRASTHAASDPLAALDRLEGTSGPLAFRGALTGKEAPTEVEATIAQLDRPRARTPEPAKPAKPEPAKPAKPEPAKPEPAKPEPAKSDTAEAPVTRPDKPKPEEPKQRYTLQLSSFQDRKEAEAFLATIKAKGYDAKITVAEVAGRGTFYRVRMGSYGSVDAANKIKAELEKAGHPSASVMKL